MIKGRSCQRFSMGQVRLDRSGFLHSICVGYFVVPSIVDPMKRFYVCMPASLSAHFTSVCFLKYARVLLSGYSEDTSFSAKTKILANKIPPIVSQFAKHPIYVTVSFKECDSHWHFFQVLACSQAFDLITRASFVAHP